MTGALQPGQAGSWQLLQQVLPEWVHQLCPI